MNIFSFSDDNVYYEPEYKKDEDKSEIQRLLENFLEELKFRDKSIIMMHLFENMTFKDISEVLKKSESTIKTQYYNVIKQAKKYFQERGYDNYEIE